MQFVTDGPDLPDTLLFAHEEGRVVLFCGAGISYPAGLPDFKGLLGHIYKLNGTNLSDIEQESFNRGRFDATLDLLERRLPDHRLAVRRALAAILKPNLRRKGATETHAALLRLARSRDGILRLVTTNFDRVFQYAAKRSGQTFRAYPAPMLPIPKNSRWNGVVYLHGLLPKDENVAALNRLVVTSGDFGLAYLTERWAARFVSELFRSYLLLFVGYSINDPILRYMMDALAADRMLGEVAPRAWALAGYEPGQKDCTLTEWEAEGVTPILYKIASGSHGHSALHKTLQGWAKTYQDGITGKESIVANHAQTRPSASTKQDDFVGRMLWALSDKSGSPAKRFAETNPAPALEWLFDALADERYQHGDLVRLGVPPRNDTDIKLRFSLVRHPAPYALAPWMSLVSEGITGSGWDSVMFHLAQWLTRHLNDPRLLIWIAQRGGQLHDRWHDLIERELDRFARLEKEEKHTELARIRSDASNAIPEPLIRTLWRIVLSGRLKSPLHDLDLFRWAHRFKRDGLTATLRLSLREMLAPKIALNASIRWPAELANARGPVQLRHLVDWQLVLATGNVQSALAELKGDQWTSALPSLLDEFQQLLRDALDLLRELGEADDRQDRSYWYLPSISPHWQNRGFRDWVTLIELLRDAWLRLRNINALRATKIAQTWFELPYPAFKRLALFAASQDGSIAPDQWAAWLLVDAGWWLWSMGTRREVFRLLVLRGRELGAVAKDQLEAAILAGPPRHMFRDDLDPNQWERLVAHSVWLHLAKLSSSGLALGTRTAERLTDLSYAYPDWQLAKNERDEFSHWISGTGDPDYEEHRQIEIAPRNRRDLVQWLKKAPPKREPFVEDNWRDVCRAEFSLSLCALCALAREGMWPAERWSEALYVWSEDAMIQRSWRYAASLVQTMPDCALEKIVQGVTWWLRTASKAIHQHESALLALCRRVLSLSLATDAGTIRDGKPVNEAINHPIGHITEALLNLWLARRPSDNDRLPVEIEPLFTQLCDVHVARFRHGRTLLASRLIALFRVDYPWTERHLLPLFNWSNAIEGKAAWEGFLWSPRMYPPLLIKFKPQFLESTHHYDALGEHRQQFAAFLTYAALNSVEGFTSEEFRDAFDVLPNDGLEESARALLQALDGAADQRENYWRDRIQPFWQEVWPKFLERNTRRISEFLAGLCIAAGSEFPNALTAIQGWLQPIEFPIYLLHRLSKSGLCAQFPDESLKLLAAMIGSSTWVRDNLQRCLDEIVKASPKLAQDARFQSLRDRSRT